MQWRRQWAAVAAAVLVALWQHGKPRRWLVLTHQWLTDLDVESMQTRATKGGQPRQEQS